MEEQDGRRRVIIEGVLPQIDCGGYTIKRAVGEDVAVEADIFADGHDVLSATVLYRREGEKGWREAVMEPLVNDRWRGVFPIEALEPYRYTIEAWVDHFKSWRREVEKKVKAGQDVGIELRTGVQMIRATAERAEGEDRKRLEEWARTIEGGDLQEGRVSLALGDEVGSLMSAYPDRRLATRYDKELRVTVDRERARYGAWYELFPRSCGSEGGRHGTFKDVEKELPRIAEMGFDVLYLPPIHPIGESFRKGKNNNPQAAPEEPGSPWGIGSKEGGHKSVHPQLGTLEDFKELMKKAREFGLELAMDIAFQCSPDHPYVREHPEWFKKRADGSIQYAENPPKKYQDIYPLDFETSAWKGMWQELKSVMEYWAEQGIRIFRVDNPHTKAFGFWKWAIAELKGKYPDLIFLSEAFTRPKVMYNLAKLGFTQSYNYFPWRNTKWELTQFMTEVTRTEVREYFRPNLWPNTPDILPQYLQYGGRPAFMARLVLAATLGASYGIYGPAYELCANEPRQFGAEEYLDSEKYEIKTWKFDSPNNIQPLISRTNYIRRENRALHSNEFLAFHESDNEQVIIYSKRTRTRDNIILVVVNLDPHHTQSAWTNLQLEELGVEPGATYQAHDLLTGARYLWNGAHNYLELNPHHLPAHIFRLRTRVRSEQDFDYYM